MMKTPKVLLEAGETNQHVLLAAIVAEYLKENKRKRRWRVFFKLLLFVSIAVGFLAVSLQDNTVSLKPHTALVVISGFIAPEATSAEDVNASLRQAFAAKQSKGVIIKINSPGGTPVQSAQINEEITRLKLQYPQKPVMVAITDIATSGGYYIAVAADKIYAHPSSIVGSIGVLMSSFGFEDAMKNLGIERRMLTSGKNKSLLDPFSPIKPEQQIHVQQMLDEIHRQFIDAVKLGRGDRLVDDPDIFSGLFWSGKKAKELGLIDEFSDVNSIARDIIDADFVLDYSKKKSVLDSFLAQIGVVISTSFLNLNKYIQ